MSINLIDWRTQGKICCARWLIGIIVLIFSLILITGIFFRHALLQKIEKNKLLLRYWNQATSSLILPEPYSTTLKNYETLLQHLKWTQTNMTRNRKIVHLLQTLGHTMPKDMQLTQLEIKSKTLTLTGEAQRSEAITHFVSRLSQQEDLSHIDLKYLHQISPHLSRFNIRAQLNQ